MGAIVWQGVRADFRMEASCCEQAQTTGNQNETSVDHQYAQSLSGFPGNSTSLQFELVRICCCGPSNYWPTVQLKKNLAKPPGQLEFYQSPPKMLHLPAAN